MKRDRLLDYLAYGLLAVLPFERIPSVKVAGISVRPSLLVGLVLIAAAIKRQPRAFSPNTAIKKALYVFLGANLVSAVLSTHPGRALEVTGFLVFVAALGLALGSVVGELDLKIAKKWLLTGALVVCAISLYQFFGDLAGLPTTATGLKPAYSSQVFGFPRVQGAALEPLYLANYLLLPMAVVLAGALVGADGLIAALLYLVALLTLSRGGVAAAAVLSMLLLGVKLGRRQFKSAAVMLAALIAALALAYGMLAYAVPALTHYRQSRAKVVATYTHQLANYEIGNVGVDRAHTRRLAIELFKLHPVFGAGPGTYGYFAHEQDVNLPSRQIVNNEPYELLGEVGIVGLGSFIVLACLLAWAALETLWQPNGDKTWVWLLALLVFLVAAAVQYWSFSTLYITYLWAAIGLLMGLVENVRMKV